MRIRPGHIIGAGLGGFLDGIVLHQILQWHNMGSAVLPPTTLPTMARNMTWDGMFHAAMWLVTTGGVLWLWGERDPSCAPRRLRGFIGELLLGWGVLNLFEGIVDHHWLELHHVRDMPRHVPAYDWIFLLAGGIVVSATGWLLARHHPSE